MENQNDTLNEVLMTDSAPQAGDGLDYDRKVAQAAREGKPLVLVFGAVQSAGNSNTQAQVGTAWFNYKNKDAVICCINVENCLHIGLRGYLQEIMGNSLVTETFKLNIHNGCAQTFMAGRNDCGYLQLYSVIERAFNVANEIGELNAQITLIKSALVSQDEALSLTPLSCTCCNLDRNIAPLPPMYAMMAQYSASEPSQPDQDSLSLEELQPVELLPKKPQDHFEPLPALPMSLSSAASNNDSDEQAPDQPFNPEYHPSLAGFLAKVDDFGKRYLFTQTANSDTQ